MVILSPSIQGLQYMLDTCHSTCQNLELAFHSEESHYLCFGKLFKSNFSPTRFGSDLINWINQLHYLGIQICAGKTLSFDISFKIRKLFFLPVTVCTLQQNFMNITFIVTRNVLQTYSYIRYSGDTFDNRAAENFG